MDESYFGILLHWTKSPGIGGSIKQKLEDFVVEEIPIAPPAGATHVAFLVEKRGLDTFETMQKIAKALGINKRLVGYAGLKDRYAITKQWMSVPGNDERKVNALTIPSVSILETKLVEDGVHLGDLEGNRFTITVRGVKLDQKETEARLKAFVNEIDTRGVPNFFGPQRFGQNRPVTHRVGKKILLGDFEGAVLDYLTLDFEGETEQVREARRRLAKEKDYKAAYDYFPRSLAYEKILLKTMADGEGPIAALRELPPQLAKLFVDAYQSYVFNLSLSRFLADKNIVDNFPAPVVGYQTALGKGEFDKIAANIMEEEGVSEENFFVERMPQLSQKGTLRSAMIAPRISYTVSTGCVRLEFALKKGSYATAVLREITKPSSS